MNWNDVKTKIKRFLRDPNANIWEETLLLHLWNDAQRNFQQDTLLLEEVEAFRVPPLFNIGYFYDWEWPYFSNTIGKNYKALRYLQQTGKIFCYRFEASIDTDYQDNTTDEGHHFTQPWEAWIDEVTPGDIVPIWFPENFDRAKLVAYDKEPLDYIDKKALQTHNTDWITHSGKTTSYWRYDDIEECYVLWPLPSSPSWDGLEDQSIGPTHYIYTFSWEEDETYIDSLGVGKEFTIYHSTQTMEYIFNWEDEHLDGGDCLTSDDIAMHAQWLHETFKIQENDQGILIYNIDDTIEGHAGAIIHRDNTLMSESNNISIDAIDFDDNIIIVYIAEATDIEQSDDESDYPSYLLKYITYDVLANAYAVNNDGRIESLRQYWEYRKEIGSQMVRRFKSLRKKDRNYRLTTQDVGPRKTRRHPRLPSEYPAL